MRGIPVDACWRRAVLCVIAVICAIAGPAGSQHVVAPQLTFVAIGSVPSDLMTSMVARFETRYQMRIDTVPPLTFDQLTFDPTREQVVAERLIQARFAVVSYARMGPRNLGAPHDESLLRARLRKMVAKNIGIIYYGLRPNNNPRSALFANILGVDDLDRMTEEFDPR